MNKVFDELSGTLRIATDLLFVRNPVGTSMGVLFGVILHMFVLLFSPVLDTIIYIKLSSLNIFYYIALGVFGFNFGQFWKRHKPSKEVDEAISYLDRLLKERKISKGEHSLQIRALVDKYIENVRLDLSISTSGTRKLLQIEKDLQ